MGVLPVLAVLGTLAGLGYVKYRGIRQAMAAASMMTEPVETVRMVAVETVPFQRFLTAVGTVSALQHLVLSTETAGKVVEVGFDSGQLVEKGQLLLRLDASTEAAELRSAEAMAELAGLTLERLTQAMADDARSHHELDRAAAEREQALGRTEQLRAMIAKKEIRAAFKGHVGMRNVHPGQYLAEGARITTLQGVADTVHVDFSLPQTAAASLAPGPKALRLVARRDLPADELGKMLLKGINEGNPRDEVMRQLTGLAQVGGMFGGRSQVASGESFGFNYLPGTGTVLLVNDKPAGEPVRDPAFFTMMMRIWLGTQPVDERLKAALLGAPRPDRALANSL